MSTKGVNSSSFLIQGILILILVFNVALSFWASRGSYLKRYDLGRVENLFFNSQFAPKVGDRRFWIDDYDLFAYLGYRNIMGEDPTKFNFETPPLGKYFFGASILIFGNPNVIQFFFSIGLLLTLFFLSQEFFKKTFWTLVPPVVLSFDLLLKQQSRLSLLDLPQTFFIILAFLVFLKAMRGKRVYSYLILGIMVGVIMTIKFLTTGLILIFSFALYLYLKKREHLKFLFSSLIVAGIFYLLAYLVFFINHPSLVDFFNLHVSMLRLYRSHVPEYPRGEIFRILFTGWWRTWFGTAPFIRADTYSTLWTLGGLSLIISTLIFFLKKNGNLILLIWIWFYLLFTSLHIVFPRLVFPILPFLYILLIQHIRQIFEKINSLNLKRINK